MAKVSQVNSAHCENWTCILKRRKYFYFFYVCGFSIMKTTSMIFVLVDFLQL